MSSRFSVPSFLFFLSVIVVTIVTAIIILPIFLSSPLHGLEMNNFFENPFGMVHALTSEDILLSVSPESTQFSSSPSSASINNSNTFFTKGLLATVLSPSPSYLKNHMPEMQNQQQLANLDENQTIQTNLFYLYPKIASGLWSLNVSKGSVTDFHANFKLLAINGLDKHFVELSDFQNVNGSPIKFDQFSSTTINGFVHVKIDDDLLMNKVPITIQLFKINTVGLVIKNDLMSNILYDNDLLGIADSFKNFRNDELLILGTDDES